MGGMLNAFLGGTPTGRNADSYCLISGGMPKQERPEMKACSRQKIK